ncbi:MAG: bifunctional demethylmenaquinone methyltransferase/2-methoxy-6-polyprenyl-1,4-benzoquinol methylase UbiE [Acidobacteriota bacterium]
MDDTLQTASPNADGSGAMFDRIAARYDRLNRILSLGMDRGWRRAAVRALELKPDMRILDLATGTGDLAFEIAAAQDRTTVVGVDPSPNMLEVAGEKLGDRDRRVSFEIGDAQDLRHETNSFDGSTIAFGIRNVPDRLAGLREMARVTRPGGRVVVLELSEPGGGPISAFARLYVHQVVPRIGAFLSGAREYRYLQESIEAFPPAAKFVEMMESVGLCDVEVRSLAFGACHLYVGRSEEEV